MSEKKSKSSYAAQQSGPRGGITKPSKAHNPHSESQQRKGRELPAKYCGSHDSGKTHHETASRSQRQQGSSTAVSSVIFAGEAVKPQPTNVRACQPHARFEFRHQWCGAGIREQVATDRPWVLGPKLLRSLLIGLTRLSP